MQKIYGLFLVCVALGIYAAAISIGIAWVAFCFGTIFIGILLLLFAPLLLLTPPMFVFSLGHAPMAYGMKLLVKSRKELLEEQLETLNKKIMAFDQDKLDYYTKNFYHTHEKRDLFPEEWKEAQAYHGDFFKTVFKRDEVYHKLNPNAPYVSTPHGVGRHSQE
ncbi:hypothetical protein ACMVC6_004512 [Vibrio parahaemolyticus]|nr:MULTISPECIES: hypothetical protein [Vibrio]RBM88577.1 hypothetical protein DLR73_07325 [Vibrio paracholerae]TOG57282.1 hypothetical protein CGI97_23980 [Vibrio parahaemolyticus]TXZ62363.1 hypothetical protein FXE23_02440 [Vibrio cholerae]GIC06484.1 hypothetical protein VCSRO50_3436 [Vibrio cholerae]